MSTALTEDVQVLRSGLAGDEPEIEVTARNVDKVAETVNEGATVSLIEPPQGGRVIFVGVRVMNMNACGARITGVLRDPAAEIGEPYAFVPRLFG